jgi:hypothetical protein
MRGDTIGGAAERLAVELGHTAGRGLVAIVRENDLFFWDFETPLTGLFAEVRALRSLSLCARHAAVRLCACWWPVGSTCVDVVIAVDAGRVHRL